MRADLHVHTRFSHDCLVAPEKLVVRCQQRGISCLAVTDHDTIEGATVVQELAPFTVIIGQEVHTSQGDIIGLFLQQTIPRNLPPIAAAQAIKEQGGLVSIPHPFDPFRSSVISAQALHDLIPYADIVETFNARNLRSRDNDRALELASEHHLLSAAVSDAHTLQEIGDTYTEIPTFQSTAAAFKKALAQGRTVERKAGFRVRLAPFYNKLHKKLLTRP